MVQRYSIQYACKSDVGCKRGNNEDSGAGLLCPSAELWWNRGHLFVVADGMGGHAVGELASKTAIDNVLHTYFKSQATNPAKAMQEAIQEANKVINTRGTANREFQRMGTTCTALSISAEGVLIGHVGDSRAYRIRSGRIEQLTFDHSLQWEKMRKTGRPLAEIMREEPKNIITRSVGPEPNVKVDLEGPYPVEAGDAFILCSDGLTHYVPDKELGLLAENLSPQECTFFLNTLACLRGGHDNVTTIVVKIGQDAPSAASGFSMKNNLSGAYKIVRQENKTALWASTAIFAVLIIAGLYISAHGHAIPGLAIALPALLMCGALWVLKKQPAVETQIIQNNDETVYVQPYNLSQVLLGREELRIYTILLRKLWHKISTIPDWKFDPKGQERLYQQYETALKQENWKTALTIIVQLFQNTLQGRTVKNISLNDVEIEDDND